MCGRFQGTNLAHDGFVVVSVQNVGESIEILLRSRHGWPGGYFVPVHLR